VFQIHCRPDGSIIQSSELDAATGRVTRHFTHKGFSDTSIWGRAQGWGMLYTAMAFVRTRQPQWLAHAMRAADWWLAHLPADGVAYWDFDDPAIPDAPRDTAATTIASAALLRLAQHAPTVNDRTRYQQAAAHSVRALVRDYLTREGGSQPAGMLVGGCFNNRADSRSHDRVTNAELIFGSYFLVECLLLLGGSLRVEEL
jgi:unsaturated chondroitin disaccharide hydrolase